MENEANTRKHGWTFGQVVYVRYTGTSADNYLSNFARGRVVMADKDTVYVIGESGKIYLNVLNEKNSNTIYTVTRFRPLREQMKHERKVDDPKFEQMLRRNSDDLRIDDLARDPDRVKGKKAKVGKKGDNTLVDLIARMSSGQLARPKRTGSNSITLDWNNR